MPSDAVAQGVDIMNADAPQTTRLDPGNPFQSGYGLAFGGIGTPIAAFMNYAVDTQSLTQARGLPDQFIEDGMSVVAAILCACLLGLIVFILWNGLKWAVAGPSARQWRLHLMYPAIYREPNNE